MGEASESRPPPKKCCCHLIHSVTSVCESSKQRFELVKKSLLTYSELPPLLAVREIGQGFSYVAKLEDFGLSVVLVYTLR